MKIAPGFTLDPDYLAGRSIALVGKKGSGKTFAMRVLVEEFHAARVQTVIIDPMGVFWGLRSSADGASEGLPIPVFGGMHGDAPLEHTAGELMADLAVGEGLSMVLDLSGFTSRTQERQFALAFLDRLYRSNKDRNLIHVMVDEADLFSPQKPRPQDAPLLAVMENLVRRGRNFGIGTTLATQRPAVLSKDVLTQADALVALRMTGPQDRDAIKSWVNGQGDADEWTTVAPSLPGLSNGQAWWWVPEQGILEQVQMRHTHTFDSSPTRTRGASARSPKKIADVDLSAISEQIAATVERAKAHDPKTLRTQIADLERALKAAQKVPARQVETVIETKTVTVQSTPAVLMEHLKSLASQVEAISGEIEDLQQSLKAHEGQILSEDSVSTPPPASRAKVSPPSSPVKPPPPVRVQRRDEPAGENGGTSPARQRLLDALFGLERISITAPHKTQLALWAGVSPKSSGYANNLGGLRSTGLIDYPSPGAVSLTDEGRALVDAGSVPDLPDDTALHWHVQSLVSPARWRLLEVLIRHFPEPLAKDELALEAGVSNASSGFANNLGALRSTGLLDYPSPGMVSATNVLFLGR